MSRIVTKPTKRHVRPAKTQISLGIHPVWSESSLCAQWVAKDLSFLHADSKDSDQTGRMSRLIWVFAGRICHFACFVTMRLIWNLKHIKLSIPVHMIVGLNLLSYFHLPYRIKKFRFSRLKYKVFSCTFQDGKPERHIHRPILRPLYQRRFRERRCGLLS